MLKKRSFLIFVLLFTNVNAVPKSVTATDIYATIHLRLSYMEDVALYKAQAHLAVEDVKREAMVIEKATSAAEQVGLNKQYIRGFFKAQISAAKAIQYRYRADLLSHPEKNQRNPVDLKSVIRPQLIKLGEKLTKDIASYLKSGNVFSMQDLCRFQKTVKSRYLNAADKELLFKALTEVKLR